MPEKDLDKILGDKTIRAKKKVNLISALLLDRKLPNHLLIKAARSESDTNKANLIESLEFASKLEPAIVDEKLFEFIVENLRSDAARVKWESAKVISNTAHLFPKKLKKAVGNLLDNSEHSGTVVRWSAARALISIIETKTSLNKDLLPAIEALEKREEDRAIKKIYQQGLKKAGK